MKYANEMVNPEQTIFEENDAGVMKYATTLALGSLAALMGTNSTIGIYMTYSIAIIFSIFDYDKKFTLRISIISYFLLVISLNFRSLNVVQSEFETNFIWFVSRSAGFLIETIVTGLICVKIADISHKILATLGDTKQVANLVAKCNESSSALQKIVEKPKSCVADFRSGSNDITRYAEETVTDCESSDKYVEKVFHSMETVDAAVNVITGKNNQLYQIAEDTSLQMTEYRAQTKQAVENMERIEESVDQAQQIVAQAENQSIATENVEQEVVTLEDAANALLKIITL